MKIVLLVAFLFAVLLTSTFALADLEDKTYKIKPNGYKCIDIELPDDFGSVTTLTDFFIKSDCKEWCDLTEALVTTDFANQITVPLCLSAKGKKIGDSGQFSVTLTAPGKVKTYEYGVCVGDVADQDSGKGEACGIADVQQDPFSISISPNPIYAPSNGDFTYEVKLYAQDDFDLEVESKTGKKWEDVSLKEGTWQTLSQKVNSPPANDVLTVTAKIKDCKNLPSCKKTASADIILAQPQEGFSISLNPPTLSVSKGDVVNYNLEITNYGDQKEYTVKAFLDQGLETDFQEQTFSISTSRTVSFKVTAKNAGGLKVVVESAGVAKSESASLTINELVTDIENSLDGGRLGDLETDAVGWLERNKNKDIGDQIDSWDDLVGGEAGSGDNGGGDDGDKPTKPVQGGSLDLVYITIPIIVVIALLFYLFYRKRKTVDEINYDYTRER